MSDPSTHQNPITPQWPGIRSDQAPWISPALSSGGSEPATPGLVERFLHHPPPNEQVARLHSNTRELFAALALALDADIPGGREKALMFTNLEQALMWANAAIARTPWES